MDIIGRVEAYEKGQRHYFTGVPCRQGHVAKRYVSTGACQECLQPFKLRAHPTRKDMQPYVCPKLWVMTGTTPEQFARLETYLQTCITAFFNHENQTP